MDCFASLAMTRIDFSASLRGANGPANARPMTGSATKQSILPFAAIYLPHRERRLVGPAERNAIDDGLHRLQQHLAVALVVAGIEEGHRPLDQIQYRDIAG